MHRTRHETILAMSLAGAFACGQVEQDLGDGSTGPVDSDIPPDAPLSDQNPSSGSKGDGTAGTGSGVFGAPEPEEVCFENGARCPRGYRCLLPWQEDGGTPPLPGVCAPGCEDLGDSGLGQPCAPDSEGTLGVCRPFTVNPDALSALESICTRDCNPLVPDCPAHYSCDVALATPGTFAFSCLPVTRHEPLLEGQLCDGMPQGQCSPGLSCVSRGSFAKCHRFCDLQDANACPSPEICVVPRDFPDGNVGVCGSQD